jgi:two-component system sensor histidine kinase KdpD
MLHGNIYPNEKVPQALTHFFRTDNLIALRELALRFLADETEEELLAHLERQQGGVLWETTERILVGVTGAPGIDAIIRRAARMAARLKADLHVVHVISGDGERQSGAERIAAVSRLASDVGAHWHEVRADDPGKALMDFARAHQITQIILGSSQRSRWQELTGGDSIIRTVRRLAAAGGIDLHIIARRSESAEAENLSPQEEF